MIRMLVSNGLGAATLFALALPAAASGTVALSPGHPRSVMGHLQGASPSGPVYAPGVSDVCVSSACDVTSVQLRLPRGECGDLRVDAVVGAGAVGLSIRVFDATGQLVGSNTAGGAAITSAPAQGAQAVIRGLVAGSYDVRLSVAAGASDFTERFALALARRT